ncbi:YebC/PmpR family DNA-binding transcriptional regulator [Candidatus Uhrbacteria bacterium]|nr:YebC/PmpR family DNA-binding transcriptional regulator [Candidatus Uhrbacteria bacterium]
MSRHSKWSKVKQFKGAIDAKRSASFTKLAREIAVAAKEGGGGDPAMNARLRMAIDRAKKASMPKDSIERAIVRGAGGGTEAQLESLMYECYAPGGTALIVECVTDNRNRTANDVKHLLSKNGATLASTGSVTYLFDRKGTVRISGGLPSDRREETELTLIDAGADDIVEEESDVVIRSAPSDLARVAEAVGKLGLPVDSAELEWIPKTLVETDETNGTALEGLIDALEELDDVQHVSTNAA